MFTVIAYDVADDARREKVSALLEDFGRRVNYSVFECLLDGEELDRLRGQLRERIDHRRDRIVFYRVCETCRAKRTMIGTFTPDGEDEDVVVV
jgi:CRISPR-associated protein Cas2